jgi:glucose-6-phosphate 1-epimerase
MSTQPSLVQIATGQNGLTKIVLSAAGARAEVYPHGAQVTSWIPSSGGERMFLSSASEFGPEASIRGGVPVIFPQFGDGPLPKHGFVRRMDWDYIPNEGQPGSATARFRLADSPASRQLWPFAYTCELTVTLTSQTLEMTLQISNPGSQPFQFTAGLHTYLDVADIRDTVVEGLGGAAYLDTVGTRTERVQAEDELTFSSEVDRIYWNVSQALYVREKTRRLEIQNSGFPHAVVWNPWIAKCAALGDMPDQGYLRMLCVEAVATGQPITLQAQESWTGSQRLNA